MSDDLVAFLRARLDEDEQGARLAGEAEGYDWTGDGEYISGRRGGFAFGHSGPDGWLGDEVGPHIARNDPARVLAEVEAKRRIIDRCDYQLRSYAGSPSSVATEWLVVRALALPYAAHPGYREEWRP